MNIGKVGNLLIGMFGALSIGFDNCTKENTTKHFSHRARFFLSN